MACAQDYDCFYAQVIENANPALKSLPLGIKQKSILATCNYVARSRGVKKLQLVSEAKKACPDLVLADGEDLSAFRDVSKKLYHLLRSYSWSNKVERLGLDEIFLDVTDLVNYNLVFLNRNALSTCFFCLSKDDPQLGFPFDASALAGCVTGAAHDQAHLDNTLYVRLLLASHLARHLRLKIEQQGYTSACGISTSKLLSKLAGSVNKPRNQTTLLSLHHDDVLHFMDSIGLRNVPGIGSKTSHSLETFVLGSDANEGGSRNRSPVSVRQLRCHPDVSPSVIEKLLGSRPGSERGIGDKIWALLHGIDDTEVKMASDVPTQISIEDTYPGPQGGLSTVEAVQRELRKLAASLLRRMYVDLTEEQAGPDPVRSSALAPGAVGERTARRVKWLAHPKTLRLSTRPKTSFTDAKPYNWGRSSRSQALPTFIFNDDDDEAIVKKLVEETLLPMFSILNPGKSGWNIGMINICVASMSLVATEKAVAGSGRDISHMFNRQDDVLREFKVYAQEDPSPQGREDIVKPMDHLEESAVQVVEFDFDHESEPWDAQDGSQLCDICGHYIPPFAIAAHGRFHEVGDELL